MTHRLRYIPLILALLAACLPARGQEPVVPDDELRSITQRYADAYDSLLNNRYLHRYHRHGTSQGSSFSPQEFDLIPDSVLMQRLQQLPAVIPMTYNSVVRSHIRFYLQVMDRRLELTLTQAELYFPLFEEALFLYGLPDELKYLPIVESALNPHATSRVGAAGLWQFMYATGKTYGLEINSLVDERRDPAKSTAAATRYLLDLYRIFNDWTLAVAAYNCGPGNINKAIARSGGKRNFWHIYPHLPRETRGYIPSLIAVNYAMHYYHLHGIHPHALQPPLRTDTLHIHRPLLFHYVEAYTGIPAEQLRSLNPQFRTPYVPATERTYVLNLPTTLVERFIALQDTLYAATADSLSRRPSNIEPLPQRNASGSSSPSSHYHTVRKGETLSSIAARYGLTVARLKQLNGLKQDKIRIGQRLKVRK
ncbi:MAG: transglycosylase SLT domain-containing protein [Bacteroidales bacterium]|nr:transglycosylase SLT domain-containing protein [Bacteroidales bacterium]